MVSEDFERWDQDEDDVISIEDVSSSSSLVIIEFEFKKIRKFSFLVYEMVKKFDKNPHL